MGKIKNELTLDTSQHDAKLKQAKKAMQEYAQEQQAVQSVMNGLSSVVSKFAGVMGVAMGATEVFNRSIAATQDATDEFGRITESVTNVVDDFFYSITTGNFADFLNGLDGIISRARDAYDALDKLGTFNIEKNFDISKLETRRSELRLQVRKNPNDKTSKKELTGIDEKLAKVYEEEAKVTEEALNAKIREYIGTEKGYEKYIKKYFKVGGQSQALADAKRIRQSTVYSDYAKQAQKFGQLSDEKLTELMNLYSASQAALQRGNQIKFTDNRLLKAGSSTSGKSTSGKSTSQADALVTIDYEWLHGNPFDEIPNKLEKEPLKLKSVSVSDDALSELDQMRENDELDWLNISSKQMSSLGGNASVATNSINAVTQAMGALSGAVNDNAAGWINWISNLASAVAQAIVAITALTAADEVEGQAAGKAAAAEGAKAVAGIPVVGPIMAIASIASIVAALASIPKFANGGLISGPTVGLMGEYPGASTNPEVVAPLDKLRNIISEENGGSGGMVEFRIAGKELVGILNKQQRSNSRNA